MNPKVWDGSPPFLVTGLLNMLNFVGPGWAADLHACHDIMRCQCRSQYLQQQQQQQQQEPQEPQQQQQQHQQQQQQQND